MSGQLIRGILWSADKRYEQAVSNLTRGASYCLGQLLEGPKASEKKMKQQQCPKALFINLKTHSKTGFPQPGETQKLSAEKHDNEFLS